MGHLVELKLVHSLRPFHFGGDLTARASAFPAHLGSYFWSSVRGYGLILLRLINGRNALLSLLEWAFFHDGCLLVVLRNVQAFAFDGHLVQVQIDNWMV